MFVSLKALRLFLDSKAGDGEIIDRLTQIGLEVEGVQDFKAVYKGFCVAFVEECERHPDSERLNICKINNGKEVLQVICGASNIRKGLKVAFANIGAVVPNGGLVIKKSKIRGTDSCGMVCSVGELGLDMPDNGGILELDGAAQIGADFASFMGLDDVIVEVAITPNRGDCVSIYGVARDLAASGIGELKKINIPQINSSLPKPLVDIKTDLCMKFGAIIVRNVKNTQSPKFIVDFLKSLGLASKGILIDITNYMLFMYGRPMHAYDLRAGQGGLCVRESRENQAFEALNGVQIYLPAGLCVIADKNESVLALGGVIGGKNSAVNEFTTDILLESAVFEAQSVTLSSRKTGVKTDSSYRFERGTDADFVEPSLAIVCGLLADIFTDANFSEVYIHQSPINKPLISFYNTDVLRLTGLEISQGECDAILGRLGFEKVGNQFKVPSWRGDIFITEDLIEEVVRIKGYQAVPMAVLEPKVGIFKGDNLVQIMAGRGLVELVNYSFESDKIYNFYKSFTGKIELENPISADMSVMRGSLLPGLLSTVGKNIAKGYKDLAFFESGKAYYEAEGKPCEVKLISGVRSGLAVKKSALETERKFDIFDIKGDTFTIFTDLGLDVDKIIFEQLASPVFHPNIAWKMLYKRAEIGVIAQLHPLKLEAVFDIKQAVFGFEIYLENVLKFTKTSKKPYEARHLQPVYRELAFIVDVQTPYKNIYEIAKSAEFVEGVECLDIFDDEARVGVGKKSLAIKITLQPRDESLTKEVIDDKIIADIVAQIKSKTGAKLRDGSDN
jgi:phenylalanyl-tRNA synthetase beta chain